MNDLLVTFSVDVYMSLVLFLSTVHIYYKVSVLNINKIYTKLFPNILAAIVIAIAYSLLRSYNHAIASFVNFLFPVIFLVLFEKEKVITRCLVSFLASCLSRVVSLIPMMVISIIIPLIKNNESPMVDETHNKLIIIIIYTISYLLTVLFLRLRRLKKGFQFFQDENNLGLGIAMSGVLLFLFSIAYSYLNLDGYFIIIVIFCILIISFGLYLWIRRSITAHYRERLQLKSEEHFQELLNEKDLENQKLNQTNEYLAKVVHRDNHLMSALNTSINAYFESDNAQYKDDLLREIQTLAKERGELIEKEQRDAKLLSTTGNLLIDGAVNDLYIKAAAHSIDFDLTVSETVDAIIGKYISQIDLQTLLCDHIKDAIIAVDAAGKDKGKIMVDLSVKNDNYQITIFDSGVDFELDILAKLGRERVTTHADSGGSGIGFMTTFETLRKAYASLMITEFANKTPFSKSVSIIFDGENSFIIQSYRSETLKAAITREDVVII